MIENEIDKNYSLNHKELKYEVSNIVNFDKLCFIKSQSELVKYFKSIYHIYSKSIVNSIYENNIEEGSFIIFTFKFIEDKDYLKNLYNIKDEKDYIQTYRILNAELLKLCNLYIIY